MRVYYLIEEYSKEIEFKKDAEIVALNPKACFDLEKEGIKHSTIEDYIDYDKMERIEDDFFDFIIHWRRRFDDFLQKHISNLNPNMTMLYFSQLRYVIGTVLFKSYMLDCFFKKNNPNNIIYVKANREKSELDYSLHYENITYFSMLAPIFCKKHGLTFRLVNIKKESLTFKKTSFLKKIKKMVRNHTNLKNLKFFFNYGIKCSKNRKTGKQKLNILLLTTSKNGIKIIKDGLKKNYNVYLLGNKEIFKSSRFGLLKYKKIVESKNHNIDYNKIFSEFKNSKLITDINKISGYNVSNIILPRFRFFIENVIPDTLKYIDFFKVFYNNQEIDFVLTPHRGNPVRIASLSVAKENDKINTVYIAHGDEAFDIGKFWDVTELKPFDIHISSNIEKKEFFENKCEKEGINTNCICSYHRLLPILEIKKKRSESEKIIDNEIIYLPGFFFR